VNQHDVFEPDPSRWRRRATSISLVVFATAITLVSLPVVLLLTLVRDGLLRQRLAWTRCALMLAWLVICECWGLLVMLGMWLASLLLGPGWLRAHTPALQQLWCGALMQGVLRLFSMRLDIDGEHSIANAGFILLVRHTSTADVLLPMQVISIPKRVTAHYVLKQELRWDPCLDVAGHRFANVFVRRGDGQAEIERVALLGDQLGPHSMVVLYPEGTRWSKHRSQKRIAELRERNDPQLSLAEQLQHALPPHLGGVAALLERAPEADVVFMTHVGLEGVRTLADIFGGALIGRTLRVRLWRVPRAEIPDDRGELRRWLYEQWLAVDRFS
jgi:1-acyl-sn-glycerol-3-phosphate acyltransferase